ncbi:MAG: twin-arginine translocation signal domain-containing protein [Acidimicrobiaceae bacterium]|nr:twin-arginine translocation signal domain-containing protein [Acidimicrobiaceae bacterium]
MPGLSRRTFLTRGSLVVAAGGVASALPGVGSLLQVTEADAPELTGAASDAEVAAAEGSGPLVAHVKDLQTGEISLYRGEQEITVRNPSMAAQLHRAAP